MERFNSKEINLTSNRFFVNEEQIKFPLIQLSGTENYHLNKVARKKPGDKVWLFDKKGKSYFAKIEETGISHSKLFILKIKERKEPRIRISLAQALVKSKAMDLIIQKSTELGIAKIIPVLSARTIVKIENKVDLKMNRWKKIVLAAAKQCGRSDLPYIRPPIDLSEFLEEKKTSKNIFLNENGGTLLKDVIKKGIPESALVLVGPEGGWTDEEENKIIQHDYESVYLGINILRTETAAVCSLGILSHFWNI